MRKLILLITVALGFSSCAELLTIANEVAAAQTVGVTNTENIAGLKKSLDVGIEKAVGVLSVENGFYNDAALKLLLPPEAQPIVDNIKLIPGGQELVNKAVLSLNRSAEDAVKEAMPIFKKSIMSMTISDATNILFGSDNAATEYLRKTTYTDLSAAFAPKVKVSLGKPLVANVSTTESWTALTSAYNKVAANPIGMIAGLKPVTVDLEQYVTEKALDALFVKVAQEEKAIRTDPMARVNDLLKRVFGQLDKK
ncbi:MAG: DUF4197 domain-containing protein [Paludibacteraceae bacterium]|nr:DUF4197 domain-containing protein [Paludibacteraceae bacterium]MBP6284498.1 DUF4197 domain-containing protein [Paludibacteraceae bacterium]